MKYLLLFILLNIYCSKKETIADIKSQIEKTNLRNNKNYPLITLGYITPWNKEGYDYVEKYSNKFDIISPTWFELKPEEIDGDFQIILDGSNNIDSSYIKKLRDKNKNILILPRLHVSFNDQKIFNIWFTKEADQFVKVLERRIKYNKFDGYVFDCMQIWFNENLLNKFVNNLLPKIYDKMQKLNKKFIITMIPKNKKNPNSFLNSSKFKKIAKFVDFVNIMTYDYDQYKDETNKYYSSPISWIKDTIDFYVDKNDEDKVALLKKILFGLPYYGHVYDKQNGKSVGTVNTRHFMDLLGHREEESFSVEFDENEYEYYIHTKDKVVSFPIIKFIEKRLELSKELNIGGCGIWEIGNGKEGLLDPL
jgi:spore germination protein YaaH